MRCPYCSYGDSKVIDTRVAGDRIRRRRECPNCGQRFTTYEEVASAPIMVMKRDGRREEFDYQKLLAGVEKACAKRPISEEKIEALAQEVERAIYSLGQAEVPSHLIGRLVLEQLREVDEVAYLRFASVYHRFPDAESLAEEIEEYKEWKRREAELASQLPLAL